MYSHGVCGIVGIIYGEKYDSLRVPHSVSTNARDSSFFIITWINNFSSSSDRSFSGFIFNISKGSCVICEIDMNLGGCLDSGVNLSSKSEGFCVRIVLTSIVLMIIPMNQTTSIRVVYVQGKVEFYPNKYK